MSDRLDEILQEAADGSKLIVFLTGAGISAESGIPTFRGVEGYWTIGSTNYRPMELATSEAFRHDPRLVWSWYLYRLGVCRSAEPNPAHLALTELERNLGDRFLLVTQNVDGLHLRAGNTPERTFQIHGNIDLMRCAAGCSARMWPIPDGLPEVQKDSLVDPGALDLLRCPDCGGLARPHVLWFDETYDEELFHWHSSQQAAAGADLLVIVGSSGATNLPMRMAAIAVGEKTPVVDVNPDEDDFQYYAGFADTWVNIREPASTAIPAIVEILTAAA